MTYLACYPSILLAEVLLRLMVSAWIVDQVEGEDIGGLMGEVVV